jgi:hypothetical protein
MIKLFILLLTPVFVLAQTAPSLRPGEGGGRITRTETYQGRSLSGYMNGGAELFHEYGFVALSVQEVAMQGAGDITVEIFRMSSPRAALGISSVSRHGCMESDPALFYVCEGAYQVQGTARENYIRIQSGTDTPAARKARRELFSVLARRLGQEKVALSPYFRNCQNVILMAGPLGVQNGMPELDEVLEGFEGYAVQGVWSDTTTAGYDLVAEITFTSGDSMKAFAGGSGDNVEYTGVAEFSGHKGWWMLRCPGNVVRVMKGARSREQAATLLMDGPGGR